MLGIDQRQNRVQQVLFGDFFVHEKRLRHRTRVSQTRGFNHHPVKHQLAFAFLFGQRLKRFTQVFTNRATNAAVVHLNDVFLSVADQNLVINVLFAKLVFDHGNFLAMRLGQDTL